MFLGEHPAKLDDKRRLYLPKKVRESLVGQIVLTRGFESCIFVWELSTWNQANIKNLERPITDLESRNIRRYLFSGAEEVEVDTLGRALVPEHLRSYATLKSEVMVIGAGDHFEIWDKEIWSQYFALLENQ